MSEKQVNTATTAAEVQQPVHQEKKKGYSQDTMNSALNQLSKFGGFNFLESTVDGVQNLNPERKARKKNLPYRRRKARRAHGVKK